MRAKDLLTAIQVDAAGELKKLSSYNYVFVTDGEKQTNQLKIEATETTIILRKQSNHRLTLNELIHVLNETKEAELFFEEKLIFGYKLIKEGIVLG